MLDYGTLGILRADQFSCWTLERPWFDNVRNVSCIPEGVYEVRPDAEGRFTGNPEVQDVPGRSEIIIHQGNKVTDSAGCILVGLTRHLADEHMTIGSSLLAYKGLIQAAGKHFTLHVTTRRAVL